MVPWWRPQPERFATTCVGLHRMCREAGYMRFASRARRGDMALVRHRCITRAMQAIF